MFFFILNDFEEHAKSVIVSIFWNFEGLGGYGNSGVFFGSADRTTLHAS